MTAVKAIGIMSATALDGVAGRRAKDSGRNSALVPKLLKRLKLVCAVGSIPGVARPLRGGILANPAS
jgi:hypothetical protein